jgi:DNA ligase D-like protein (predicted polymerase)
MAPKHGDPIEYQVGARTIRVSSPEKVYFPERGITKRQVVEYYIAVGQPLLRAIGERPTTLKRYVDGVTGEPFYAKRVPKGAPAWVDKVEITFPSGRKAEEICPTEPAVFAWAANLGTFDFHPWPVRRPKVDHPDELRIDVDPPDQAGFDDAVAVAGTVREVLEDAGLVGYPKTSGGRGVHVLVRIRPEWDSSTFGTRRSRSAGRWSGAHRSGRPSHGGRKNAGAGCSWTSTRPHGIAPWRRPGPCAAPPARPCRRR